MSEKEHPLTNQDDLCPNDYTFLCVKRIILVLCGIILVYSALNLGSEHWGLKLPATDLTVIGLCGSLSIVFVAYFFGRQIDHADPKLKYIFIFLTVLAVTLVQTFMTYIVILTAFAPLLVAAQYSDKKAIYSAYVLSLISSFIVVIASYEFGLCDANMIIMPENRIAHYGDILSAPIKPLNEVFPSLFLLFILPRLILITALTPLINSIVTNRKEIIIRDMKYMSEHDGLTGFYNRNKYTAMIDGPYIEEKNIAIVFFDINNLKFINDTEGHAVGDTLIMMAADSIKRALDDNCDAYRFGGDEFMVVINNGDEMAAEHFAAVWESCLYKVNAEAEGLCCEVAIGYSSGAGREFRKILREADMQMYENKKKAKMAREIS